MVGKELSDIQKFKDQQPGVHSELQEAETSWEMLSQQTLGLRADTCIPNTREDQRPKAIQYRDSLRPAGTT